MLNILALLIALIAVLLMLRRSFGRGNLRPEHHREPVVTQSSEAAETMGRTMRSKAYRKGLALLFIVAAAAALFAFLYLTPD